jgi:hypothetical protein
LGKSSSVVREIRGSRSGWVVGNDRGRILGGFVCQVEMAAEPPLLELRSQLGPSQDCLIQLQSQMPSAISDVENRLCACALACLKCLLLCVLLCRRVLDSVVFTGALKWPRGVSTRSPAAAMPGYFRLNFRCPVCRNCSCRFAIRVTLWRTERYAVKCCLVSKEVERTR